MRSWNAGFAPASQALLKEAAAKEAVKHVKDGMVVGLGSGSTASIAIRLLGDKVKEGWKLVGIPTSGESETLGRSVGITIGELKDYPDVDLTIDGADEVDPGRYHWRGTYRINSRL